MPKKNPLRSRLHPVLDKTAQPSAWDEEVAKLQQPGVWLAAVGPKVPDEHALAAIAKMHCRGAVSFLPVKDARPVCALYGGDVVGYEAHNALLAKYRMGKNAAEVALAHFSTQPSAYWTEELFGMALKATPSSCVMIAPCANVMKPAALSAFAELAQAQATQLTMLGRLDGLDKKAESLLLARATIIMQACEPDPGHSFAFTIDFPALSAFQNEGRGKAMVQIGREAGRYNLQFERYIASSMVDRVVWRLRAERQLCEDIAKVVGIDVQEVGSRLDAMRRPNDQHIKLSWRDKYSTFFDFKALDGRDRAKN